MITAADETVRTAYNLLLNREPEPAAIEYWTAQLQKGLPQDQFVQTVLESGEFREKVSTRHDRLYDDVDLIIPIVGRQWRVPATDRALVPHLLDARCWEPHLTRYLLRELAPSDVFLDVGANVGYYVVLSAPHVERVVAFEPGER